MPTERDFNQAVILAMLDRAAQGGQTVGDDLDSIAEYAQSQRRTKSVQARAHIFAGPVNRLKQYLHKGGQPAGPRTATPKPSGPHAGKPCKPGLSAARTGCIPKKKPGAGGGDKKTTPEGRAIMADAIHSHISKLLAGGEITATQVNMVKDALLKLTVSEITALKKKLGLKASGLKAELAQKIAERALAGKKPKTEEGEADGGQTGEPPSEGWWEDDEPADEGSGADAGEDEGAGGELAPEVGGSGDETVGGEGADDDQPTGEETPEDVPTLKELKAKKQRISKKLKQYASEFRKSGNVKQAEWMDDFRTQIESLGVEAAMEALGEEKEIRDENDKIQYVGAYDDLVLGADKDSKFIKQYLEKSGIILAGATIDPNLAVISSWSKKNLEAEKRTVPEAPGNYIPTDQTFANKLEESKHLPGLESSEDIHKIVGSQVTHFTPDVIAKLDERFGKGKWIVKSYGEEAFAGFGIFFPQRVKQIKIAAQSLMRDARAGLKAGGYKLLKGKGGSVVGVSKGGKQFKIGTEEFAKLGKKTQRLTRQAVQASHAANGAALPLSPEDSLKNDYGISFTRDEDGVPDGVVNSDGKEYKFDDPKYKDIADIDVGAAGYAIERAKEADEWRRQGYSNEPKFMVQPAFEAVGVSDYDRAMGNTWETAKEGRVHVTVQNGKAKAVPFATLVGRGDDLPAVFHSDDTREMEKAVEDAINQLPESERTGQIYAPDVMKTKDGWKVIELNPSAVGGGSDWLGRNPFVIDAVVSQLTNREPQHVRFVRDLLKSEGVGKGKKPKLPEGGGKFPAKPVSHLPQKGPAGTTAAAPKLTPAERQSAKKKLGDKYWGNKETQPYYRPGPNPTVDNVITRDGPDGKEVLLIKRKDGTVEGGKWALPGGFHDTNAKKGEPWKPGHETAQQAALRELAEETGLDAKALADHMKEVGEYEGGGRDPRDNDEAWSKSNAFSLHLPPELAQQAVAGQDDASDAKWVPVSQLKPSEMAFDHGKIFQDATGKKKEVPAVVIKGKPHEGQPCKPGLTTARDGCIARHGSVGRTQSGSYAPSGKPGAIYTVKYGSLSARYAIYTNKKINGPSIPLPNYKQKDDHSCGFVAALTVGRFFNTGLTAVEVLKAVRPTKSGGIDGGSLAEALKKIGVEAEFRSDLTIKRLRAKVEEGTPVLLTVYPEGWSSDHWVAVQGFDDERIYLTNYKSLPLPQFKKEWFEVGDGLVCKQTKIMTELEHTPPGPQNHLPTGKKKVYWRGAVVKGNSHAGEACKPGWTQVATGCKPKDGSGGGNAGGSAAPQTVKLPKRPFIPAAWVKTARVMDELEEMAEAGDLEGLKEVDVSGVKINAYKWKKELIQSLEESQGAEGGASKPASHLPRPAAMGKVDQKQLPPKPYSSKPKVSIALDDLESLALVGDLDGLKAFKVKPNNDKVSAYKNSLITIVNLQLNPLPPPKKYNGGLDELIDVHRNVNTKSAQTADKIGFYLTTAKPGIPTSDFDGLKVTAKVAQGDKLGFDIPGHAGHMNAQEAAWGKFTPEGRDRFERYTSESYGAFNAVLWNGGPGKVVTSTGSSTSVTEKDYDNAVALAKEMIDKAPTLPTGTMLHRGVGLSENVVKQLLSSVGTVVQETGFASTRITEGTGFASNKNVQWRLKCAAGVKGMWAGTHGANKNEAEFVLPPNSRYLITGYEIKGGKYFIDAVLLPTMPNQCC